MNSRFRYVIASYVVKYVIMEIKAMRKQNNSSSIAAAAIHFIDISIKGVDLDTSLPFYFQSHTKQHNSQYIYFMPLCTYQAINMNAKYTLYFKLSFTPNDIFVLK